MSQQLSEDLELFRSALQAAELRGWTRVADTLRRQVEALESVQDNTYEDLRDYLVDTVLLSQEKRATAIIELFRKNGWTRESEVYVSWNDVPVNYIVKDSGGDYWAKHNNGIFMRDHDDHDGFFVEVRSETSFSVGDYAPYRFVKVVTDEEFHELPRAYAR